MSLSRMFFRCFVCICLVVPAAGVMADDDDDNGAKGPKLVTVHCDSGGSKTISKALGKGKKRELVIEFDGTCGEDVAIERGNLTIRGLGPTATIQGSVTVGSVSPIAGIPSTGPVLLQNLNIDMSSGNGLVVGVNSVVLVSDLLVTNNLGNGILVGSGGWLRCDRPCNSSSNAGYGLLVDTNGTAELGGTGSHHFSDNGVSGIGIGSSGQLTVGPESGASVLADDNARDGITVFNGGSLSTSTGTTIGANRNGGPIGGPVFGSGVLVGTGASGLLAGETLVDANDFGILSVAGKLLIFGDVTATNNIFGLFTQQNGTLRLIGATNTLDNNFRGVQVDGSYLQLFNATYSGNTGEDVRMLFGAKAQFSNSALATVFCDDPTRVLIQSPSGNVACP